MARANDTQNHVFLGANHRRNERKVWLVIALTTVTMIVEITAGTWFGSMALVADGWHMSTHAGAMLLAALAYYFARRLAHDPRFSFGTGKLGDLAAFASAVVLAVVALLIGWESVQRVANPVDIDFTQAIMVAIAGLVVNLVCAWLLRDDHAHSHGGHAHHDHDHDVPAAPKEKDTNLRAAYVHVLTDALTSVLAIAALVVGSISGWLWADPLMGIVGALIIANWSISLMRETGGVLLDATPECGRIAEEIRKAVTAEGDAVTDLHVWQVGPGHHAAIVSVSTLSPKAPSHYKTLLARVAALSHVTVEVEPQPGPA